MAMEDVAYQDFDSVIGEEADTGGSYVTLTPGIYAFTITKDIEKEEFSGSAKMPACWKVNVTLDVDGRSQGEARVFSNFFMTQKSAWKVKQFFISLGLISPDTKEFRPPWNQIIGRSGVVEISNREYNGKTYNDAKAFLPHDEGAQKLILEISKEAQEPAPQAAFNYPQG